VKKVLFPMEKKGLWWNKAYVILSSAEDIFRAVAKHGLHIGTFSVKG